MLAELIAELLEETVPPGYTMFSVTVAADCAPDAETCEGAKKSPFYGAWVRKETREEGLLRYKVISQAIVKAASKVLCKDENDKAIDGCTPFKPVSKNKTKWGVMYLSLAAGAVATYESGFREDVMVGRGHAKKISADGGQGRGPGSEGCLSQIHPAVAWRFADVDGETYAAAKRGDPAARETVIQSLLGADEEALVHCFTTSMRMLITARAHCSWAAPKSDQAFAMMSLYGTGNSCTSSNYGKTALCHNLYVNLVNKAREELRQRSKKSTKNAS